ncbi:MAG: septal ring lytic transglycosylase RlpA family protein, partial [Deltaproteobacteria bacterium]|nr:septal ring lytic transglycosylase RlpA family protein [Deltaproteobacteria bacterium]
MLITVPYKVTKGAVKTAYVGTKVAVKTTVFAGKTVYTIGDVTYRVVKAPFEWPLTHDEIESIDGLPPKKAIRQGRVKDSPYIVNGRRYVPFSAEYARKYRQTGLASWYGTETLRQKGGHMTANGEAFDPEALTAAHKYLPLPCHVRVTNLENKKSLI